MVWVRISLGGHTDLHVFRGGTLTGVRYRDEILDPYAGATVTISFRWMIMHNFTDLRVVVEYYLEVVEYYLEGYSLERLERPAQSPDLNPINIF